MREGAGPPFFWTENMIKVKDPVSGWTHFAGALLAVAGFGYLVTIAAIKGTAWHVVSFAVFGLATVLLYTSSALYHMLRISQAGTLILKRLDHIMIFMVIAGTYTPLCLLPLRGAWGWSLFGAVWGLALAGVFLKVFFLGAPRLLSTAIYLVMGWLCVVAGYPIVTRLPAGALLWLALGGMFYTGGAVIYALKRPDPWPGVFGFHEIWHLCVLAGTFCHFWVMLRYLLG